MKSKLNNKSGSAMILAIILMLLVSIVIIMFSTQIVNGIRMSSRNYEDLKVKYILEAGVEDAISEIYKEIDLEYNDSEWREKYTLVDEKNLDKYDKGTYEESIDIHINDKNSEDLKYCISSVDITMKITIHEYGDKRGIGNNEGIEHVIDSVKINTNPIIKVTKEYNNKLYEMQSQIEFKISDIKNFVIEHEIISWKQIK